MDSGAGGAGQYRLPVGVRKGGSQGHTRKIKNRTAIVTVISVFIACVVDILGLMTQVRLGAVAYLEVAGAFPAFLRLSD